MRVESLLLCFFFAITFSPACSNGTGLSGDSKEKKKDGEKQQTSADGTQEGSANNRPTQEAVSEQDNDDDSDLSVIPPEVVSAAYLTCSNDTGTIPEIGDVHIGCSILKENGDVFPVAKEKQDWSLKAQNGAELWYKEIEIPAGSRFQKIYGVSQETYDAGISPVVNIEASDSSIISVKKKGVVRINGKETE